MLLQTLGVLIQGAGIYILFLHWRAKRRHGGGFLAAGWALILLGAAPWFFGASPERALAIATFAPMTFGLALLAPDALPRLRAGAARKRPRPIPDAEDNDAPQPGHALRIAGRWFAALIAAPLLALAAAAAYQALIPGSIADRTVFSGFLAIAMWASALLWLLAAAKPWRAAGSACAGALLLSALAFMAVSRGAA
jgi:hypothetical protein